MTRYILDEITERLERSKAARICVTPETTLAITETVDFGGEADLAKLAVFAKIVAACGFAETQKAFRVMRVVALKVGDSDPPLPHPEPPTP